MSNQIGNKYLASLTILILGFIVAKAAGFLFARVVKVFTAKTKTHVDDLIIAKIEFPLFMILFLLIVDYTLLPFKVEGTAWGKTLFSLIAVIVAYMISAVFGVLIDTWGKDFAERTESDIDDVMLPLIENSIAVIIYIIALLIILSQWGVEIAPLIASLGIAGIAIGLALKDTLANIFGGIQIIFDKAYKIGDIVTLDSGESGTIYEIGLRSTKIKTWDWEILTIPNMTMASIKITNRFQPDNLMRVKIPFGVEYGSDTDKTKKIAMDMITHIEGCLPEPAPSVYFKTMGDFSLNFEAMFYIDVKKTSLLKAEDQATTNIYKALGKHGIGIPFPTRTVHMINEQKPARKKRA